MLYNRGLEYTAVDVTEDPAALAFVKGLGYSAAPVVYTSYDDGGSAPFDEHWSGFNADRIKAIVK
jgi:glutaredoxin-like protein NrdH